MNLKEQQAEAWRLAPDDALHIRQDVTGWWKCPKSGGGCRLLYRASINGWHWRNTLQTREEWEAMRSFEEKGEYFIFADEKYMPNEGDICFLTIGDATFRIRYLGMFDNHYYVEDLAEHDLSKIWTEGCVFSPIQTSADKARDTMLTKLAGRFCRWQLPKDFNPDAGIEFTPLKHPHEWPVGTNLFTVEQAKKMFGEILGPDEFVAKRLTKDMRAEITVLMVQGKTYKEIIDVVQNAMLGEEN